MFKRYAARNVKTSHAKHVGTTIYWISEKVGQRVCTDMVICGSAGLRNTVTFRVIFGLSGYSHLSPVS